MFFYTPKRELKFGVFGEICVNLHLTKNARIWDDGDGVTVSRGNISHGHFSFFNSDLTQSEMELEVAEQVVDFLKMRFADKYLLFKSNGSGDWQHLDDIEKPFVFQENTEYFAWSGLFNVSNLNTNPVINS